MNRNRNSIFWGLMLIAVACYLILCQLHIVTLAVSITKLILGVIFVGTAINSIIERSFAGFFFSLAFLWIIFDNILGLPHISTKIVIIVALLLTIGFSMLFPKKNFNYKYSNQNKHAEWDDYDDPDKVSERKEYWMAQRMGLCNFHVLRHAHWLHLEHCILIGMRG